MSTGSMMIGLPMILLPCRTLCNNTRGNLWRTFPGGIHTNSILSTTDVGTQYLHCVCRYRCLKSCNSNMLETHEYSSYLINIIAVSVIIFLT